VKLIVLVGPPGSGKSTYREQIWSELASGARGCSYISQDEQGREGSYKRFQEALNQYEDIIVDRMNFDKKQRNRYIEPARKAGYEVRIVVFHVPRETCFNRIMARENHPTINGLTEMSNPGWKDTIYCEDVKQRQANSALDTFFTKYERVEDSEADVVTRLGWVEDTHKTKPAVIIDLDGTLCNIDHRLHHVKHENRKHNRWDLFNKEIPNDKLNEWCKKILGYMGIHHPIILCSGRVDSSRNDTETWLVKHEIKPVRDYRHLFMRHRQDYRTDYIIKEIILDFEILTRYNVLFAIDDRKQVVDMWRRRGIVCLQCAEGEF
jgi:adenylate kinase family enzyme